MDKALNIFNYTSYKKFLTDWLDVVGERGSLTRMAEAAGCHRTYLSQVLNSKVELTLDHAACLIPFLSLNEIAGDYFLTCVLYERASLKEAKAHFLLKLNKVSRQQQTVSARITPTEKVSPETNIDNGYYYSSSSVAAVHIATSCQETQTIAQIARRYNYASEVVEKNLNYLLSLGLVTKSGSRYIHSGKVLHLERSSHYTRINHLNWRLLASEDSQSEESIHYTNVFSISKKDWPLLKTRLLDFIVSQNTLVHSSGAEEVFTFCCDLFPPSRMN
jgi:uncharacterized protein (TIGR02147 family)